MDIWINIKMNTSWNLESTSSANGPKSAMIPPEEVGTKSAEFGEKKNELPFLALLLARSEADPTDLDRLMEPPGTKLGWPNGSKAAFVAGLSVIPTWEKK